jgi:diguanylate cyclase (GGDEF)-like protein/PAS domain S-box-containing protein
MQLEDQKANILVVDDNAGKRLALVSVLEGLKQNIITADSGRDALRCLLEHEFAVILLDVRMPIMNGFEAARLIRSRQQSESTPIIFVTAFSHGETDMVEGYSIGAVDFIFTPIIPEILRAKVSVFVDLYHKIQTIKRHEEHLEIVVEQRTIALTSEIAERKQAEVAIRKLSSAMEKVADSIFITDANGIIEYINPAFESITGYCREEALGQTPRVIKSGKHDEQFYQQIWETLLEGEVYRNVLINRRKDGELYHEAVTITPLTDEYGKITHYISSGKDITESIQTQERLHHLAHHDALTGLPNRILFVDRLKHALIRAERRKRAVAVMFLDMDRFKIVNDTLGHEAGDRLLQAMAARLHACVREGDTVARFGGDEFAGFLSDVASPEDVALVVTKFLDALAPPFMIDGHELFISGSIGISLYPEDGTDTQTLMKNADTAMYRAKQRGGNIGEFYHQEMTAHAVTRLSRETGLRRALEKQEFVLHYQPQFDLNGGEVVGFEALIRWENIESGAILPADFIPLLEETGLIVPVGEWILRTACAQHHAWQVAGLPPLRMAVNISSRQFDANALMQTIRTVMQEEHMLPEFLELEITESILMKNAESDIEALQALSRMGMRFAIDDFGTGYSSLTYLKRFPINVLKIDKAFVHDITANADDAAIVRAIITMAHSLGMKTVAEGVETREQLDFLRTQGCDYAQGFYFSPPLPGAEIEHLLKGNLPLNSQISAQDMLSIEV